MSAAIIPPDRLLDLANRLPAAPQIMAQLSRLLHDPSVDLEQIGALLRRDAALAVRILRVANSAAFRGEVGVSSIEEALQRVGFSEVYRLAGIAAVNQLGETPMSAYGLTSGLLGRNALFTALACESLAKRAGADSRAAYTVGLFRSIGKLVLGSGAKGVPGPDFPACAGFTLEAWEQVRFGITSPEVGSIVLKVWGFADVIIAGVLEQYFSDPLAPNHQMAAIVNLAGGLAAQEGLGLPGEEPAWAPSPMKLACAHLLEAALAPAAEEARAAFSRVGALLEAT
jgi:HD-like signal output (HDOD) protein